MKFSVVWFLVVAAAVICLAVTATVVRAEEREAPSDPASDYPDPDLLQTAENIRNHRVWNLTFNQSLYTPICNVDRVRYSELSVEEFESLYYGSAPVIIELDETVNSNKKVVRLSQKKHLLNLFPRSTVISLSYASPWIPQQVRIESLHEFITEMMLPHDEITDTERAVLYLGTPLRLPDPEDLATHSERDWKPLLRHYYPPRKFMLHGHHVKSVWFGPSASGDGFHHDGPMYFEVLHGKQRWWLLPPQFKYENLLREYSRSTPILWLQNEYDELSTEVKKEMLECVIGPGDLLVVPHGWQRSMMNLGETFQIVIQDDPESTYWPPRHDEL